METNRVDSPFVRRLAAASHAAWWTLLVAVIIATIHFFAGIAMMRCEALRSWMLCLMGTDVDTTRIIMLRFVVAEKFVVVLGLLACIFLSLWVRRLRRVGDA
jgi:hypothetical protein